MTTHRAWLDDEYEDETLTAVSEYTDNDGRRWWTFGMGGMGIGAEIVPGVSPQPGDRIRLWGRGFGYAVRGIAINQHVLRYETEDEISARFKREGEKMDRKRREEFEAAGRAELDAKYAALPPVFQRRLDKFRANNPEFRWKYEGYEMFCCEQAVAFATTLRSAEAIREFRELPYEEQRKRVPAMDDSHSGNTFGAACALAVWYLEQPENVVAAYGALAPLVGSKEYGCVPKEAP